VLSLGAAVRIFVSIEPVDMRGSFDALAGAVRRMGLEPLDGHLYLFFNRKRQLCKIVWFDGSGLCLYSKRLERGTFELPEVAAGVDRVAVDSVALTSLLQGIQLRAPRRRWYRRSESSASK
jgi:transposase